MFAFVKSAGGEKRTSRIGGPVVDIFRVSLEVIGPAISPGIVPFSFSDDCLSLMVPVRKMDRTLSPPKIMHASGFTSVEIGSTVSGRCYFPPKLGDLVIVEMYKVEDRKFPDDQCFRVTKTIARCSHV